MVNCESVVGGIWTFSICTHCVEEVRICTALKIWILLGVRNFPLLSKRTFFIWIPHTGHSFTYCLSVTINTYRGFCRSLDVLLLWASSYTKVGISARQCTLHFSAQCFTTLYQPLNLYISANFFLCIDWMFNSGFASYYKRSNSSYPKQRSVFQE